jgi:hypothetical protein
VTAVLSGSHRHPGAVVVGAPRRGAQGAAGFRIVARIPKDGWDSLGTP